VFKRAKTFHALDRAATVAGYRLSYPGPQFMETIPLNKAAQLSLQANNGMPFGDPYWIYQFYPNHLDRF
jgi:hypothetical protein